MLLTYNLVTRLYFLIIRVFSIVNDKAKKLYQGQHQALHQLANFFETINTTRVVWIHTASLGEFEQARPIIEALRANHKDIRILLTFFSPSGYEIRSNYDLVDLVTYLPFDTRRNAQQFVSITKPTMAIFVKYEFWYHYFEALSEKEIPLLSVSTIFKPTQPFFKWYGGLHRKMLKRFDHFFVQNHDSFNLLQSLGITDAKISGDTRYDRVKEITNT
ncbi:MAG: glycosyltransferase N-terminal domain-containing protein, partial [Bacteroidota bacterium]